MILVPTTLIQCAHVGHHRDYVAMPHLDNYEEEDLDERQYGLMDPQQRLAAEEELDRRDQRRRFRAMLAQDDDDGIYRIDVLSFEITYEYIICIYFRGRRCSTSATSC